MAILPIYLYQLCFKKLINKWNCFFLFKLKNLCKATAIQRLFSAGEGGKETIYITHFWGIFGID